MKEVGVKRIVYSVNDDLVKTKLKDYVPSCMSLGRQFIENGFNPIYRDRAPERQIVYDCDKDSYTSDTASDSTSVISSGSD